MVAINGKCNLKNHLAKSDCVFVELHNGINKAQDIQKVVAIYQAGKGHTTISKEFGQIVQRVRTKGKL